MPPDHDCAAVESTEFYSGEDLVRMRQRQYENAYSCWISEMTIAERAELKALGLALPVVDGFTGCGVQPAAERPEIGVASTLIDGLEPLTPEPGEKAWIIDSLSFAMAWVTKEPPLVQVAMRAAAMIQVWEPTLAGLPVNALLVAEFETFARAEDGSSYGPLLEWIRRGSTMSQIGQRFLVMVYVMRPALIGSSTLAELGKRNKHTRQGWNNLVQDFRDTFQGIKNRMMRGEDTRIACRDAQLLRG